MAEGTLNAFIAALRAHAPHEEQVIASEAQAVRRALQEGSKSDKAEAALKVAYLRMLGLDCGEWSAAGMLEVMSYSTQAIARPGFLACSMCFNDKTPVILLAVNLLRKRMLNAADVPGVCAALNTAAAIATPEIASALHLDVVSLLQSGKAHVRNRACVCILAFIRICPAVLLVAYPHLKELLMDEDSHVKATACSALLEIVSKQPQNYTNLAPLVYTVLDSGKVSSYCAMKGLILLRILCPYEPRLGPKLVPLLTKLLQQECLAVSLLNEVARLVIDCLPANLDLSQMCMQMVKERFIVPDSNLKVAGLQLLASALDRPPRGWPEKVKAMLDADLMKEIAVLVQSPHPLMRSAALKLLKHSVTQKNFPGLAKVLLDLVESDRDEFQPEAKSDFVEALLCLAETKNFELVDDMKSYVATLMRISLRPDIQGAGLAAVKRHVERLADDPDHGGFILRSTALHLESSHRGCLSLEFGIKFYLQRMQQAVDIAVPHSSDATALEELARLCVKDSRRATAVAAALSFPTGGPAGGFVALLAKLLQEAVANVELPSVTRGLALVGLARLAATADSASATEPLKKAVSFAGEMLLHRHAAIRLGGRVLTAVQSLERPAQLLSDSQVPGKWSARVEDYMAELDTPFGDIVPQLLKPRNRKKTKKKTVKAPDDEQQQESATAAAPAATQEKISRAAANHVVATAPDDGGSGGDHEDDEDDEVVIGGARGESVSSSGSVVEGSAPKTAADILELLS